MSLDWGKVNTNSGYSEADSANLAKLGGLLGNLKGFMTDDKGLFQGGEHGRLFGRARDWLDDRFGWGDDDSVVSDDLIESGRPKIKYGEGHDEEEFDIETFDDFEETPINDPFNNINFDSVKPGQNRFLNNESILGDKDEEVKEYLKTITPREVIDIEDDSQEDGIFTHGVDPVFSFKNPKFGQGETWLEGYDPFDIQHWSPDNLSKYDDQTKNLYGGGPLEESPFSYNNSLHGGGTNLGFDNNFSFGNNQYSTEDLGNFMENSDFINNSFLGQFINTNPSKVDNDLTEGSGQASNTGGAGENWRGNY